MLLFKYFNNIKAKYNTNHPAKEDYKDDQELYKYDHNAYFFPSHLIDLNNDSIDVLINSHEDEYISFRENLPSTSMNLKTYNNEAEGIFNDSTQYVYDDID